MKTRTGGFEIGFRRGWSDWQKNLDGLLEWSKQNDLGVIDVGSDADSLAPKITQAGLRIGSADLKNWRGLISPDPGKRKACVEENAAYIGACAPHGIRNYFAVMLPDEPERARSENFGFMVEGLSLLAPVLDSYRSFLVIEGWPGPGALACTPEGYKALFEAVPSPSMAVNFDPSHLIRMGIEPIHFLKAFASRVKHVHGKDTELLPDGLYEYGHEQPPTFGKPRGFGGMSWRYTIPGHGGFRWTKGFEILRDAGYDGAVCIELEDENFNTDEAGEKQGLLAGARFLESV